MRTPSRAALALAMGVFTAGGLTVAATTADASASHGQSARTVHQVSVTVPGTGVRMTSDVDNDGNVVGTSAGDDDANEVDDNASEVDDNGTDAGSTNGTSQPVVINAPNQVGDEQGDDNGQTQADDQGENDGQDQADDQGEDNGQTQADDQGENDGQDQVSSDNSGSDSSASDNSGSDDGGSDNSGSDSGHDGGGDD